mgnify:CR=1 FL=1|tara:strand:- start:1612 stop:1884 length:273 start_codon:yes stop_codon:yes gene_type:complete
MQKNIILPESIVSVLVANARMAKEARQRQTNDLDKSELIVHNSNMQRLDNAIFIAEKAMFESAAEKTVDPYELDDDDFSRSKEAWIEGRR